MKTNLLQLIEERGYPARVVSARHLPDLQESVKTNYERGHFDQVFYRQWLADEFDFNPPQSLLEARSLIVVAVRQPQVQFTFTWQEKQIPTIVPPIYLYRQETNRQVERDLTEILAPEGYRVVEAVVPKKLLAVQSGLAEYGRNNLAYVPGMGSFHRLVTFFSNLSCEEDGWREPRMMERCEKCRACVRRCPSGAITTERFLLYGERCIVAHNERPSEIPFPDWLEVGWHNCLVGCMRCQSVCPENQRLEWIEERVTFSAEETIFLLEGMPLDQLPDEMVQKLETTDLAKYFHVLSRNLKVLFEGMG